IQPGAALQGGVDLLKSCGPSQPRKERSALHGTLSARAVSRVTTPRRTELHLGRELQLQISEFAENVLAVLCSAGLLPHFQDKPAALPVADPVEEEGGARRGNN